MKAWQYFLQSNACYNLKKQDAAISKHILYFYKNVGRAPFYDRTHGADRREFNKKNIIFGLKGLMRLHSLKNKPD